MGRIHLLVAYKKIYFMMLANILIVYLLSSTKDVNIGLLIVSAFLIRLFSIYLSTNFSQVYLWTTHQIVLKVYK